MTRRRQLWFNLRCILRDLERFTEGGAGKLCHHGAGLMRALIGC